VSGILGFELLRMLQVKIDYRDGLVDFAYDASRGIDEPPGDGGWPTLRILRSQENKPSGCPVLACFWLGRGSRRLGNANAQGLSHTLAFPTGPLRLDFHHAFNPCRIVPEAAPRPVFRVFHESTLLDGASVREACNEDSGSENLVNDG